MKSFAFQWHISDRCNLRCSHCYQDDFSNASERPLRDLLEMADRVFAAIPKRRVSINVTGGEPLVAPWIFELLAHLERFDNLTEVNLITNGTVAGAPVIERLARCAKLGCLKVSVESADEAVNDAIRGPGNLARVMRNVAVLRREAGARVVLMATLSRRNLGSIEGLARLAREMGADGVIFERFVPLGQGRALRDEVLGPDEWMQAVVAIARVAGSDADLNDLLPYRAFWLAASDTASGDRLSGALCNLGDEAMALMPDGAVFPCRRLPLPQGNVLETPFVEILERLASFSREVEGCAGCRALAYALTGDYLADEPGCPA
ncbi:MAG: radical SAM protein [Deltaproteobacteria bacterium]|nr:radical SAM protein [Deltaproteobacteria bacterium]